MDYDQELINEMCEKVNLLEYASNFFEFKRNGNDSFVTNCPLHSEKTPSLSIFPSSNSWYCFGCGKGGNMLTWLTKIENMKFQDAVTKLSHISGIEVKNLKSCNCMLEYKKMKALYCNKSNSQIVRTILDKSVLEKFTKEYPEEWLQEGISKDAMDEFEIMVDHSTNRIVYPVYDSKDNLIGIKGRTRYKEYKLLGISKYMNYYKIGTCDYLQGMKQCFHRKNLEKKCVEILIFEGIKSVMKAYSWGYTNSVAAETSCLNESQVRLLISLGVKEVTICFDEDVDIKKIIDCTKMLRKFCNVYVVQDRKYSNNKLLQPKDSPVDRGREIFETLLAERTRI